MSILKITNTTIDIVNSLPKVIQKTSCPIATDAVNPQKLTSTLDCLAANAIPAINKTSKKQALPEFIYHITSKENYEKILKDGKIIISEWEAQNLNGCKGIYFVDRDNFLNKWVGRKEPELFGDSSIDIGELLMLWTCKGINGTVAIQIPTSKLNLSQLRFRPYIEACRVSLETLNPDTLEIGSELVKKGLSIDDLPKFANSNEPIEYIYTGELASDVFSGYKVTTFSDNIKEMIHNLFD